MPAKSTKPAKPAPEIPVIAFATARQWNAWLAKHHATAVAGLWLRIYKKDSGIQTVTYDQALDEALCYGWIDGQKKSYDKTSWLQKFTPRRKNSLWSLRNTEHVARLVGEGRMRPAGQAEVDAARADGRWDLAYGSQAVLDVPDDFLAALDADPPTRKFFDALSKSDKYSIAWRLATARKPETRERRMGVLLEQLRGRQRPH